MCNSNSGGADDQASNGDGDGGGGASIVFSLGRTRKKGTREKSPRRGICTKDRSTARAYYIIYTPDTSQSTGDINLSRTRGCVMRARAIYILVNLHYASSSSETRYNHEGPLPCCLPYIVQCSEYYLRASRSSRELHGRSDNFKDYAYATRHIWRRRKFIVIVTKRGHFAKFLTPFSRSPPAHAVTPREKTIDNVSPNTSGSGGPMYDGHTYYIDLRLLYHRVEPRGDKTRTALLRADVCLHAACMTHERKKVGDASAGVRRLCAISVVSPSSCCAAVYSKSVKKWQKAKVLLSIAPVRRWRRRWWCSGARYKGTRPQFYAHCCCLARNESAKNLLPPWSGYFFFRSFTAHTIVLIIIQCTEPRVCVYARGESPRRRGDDKPKRSRSANSFLLLPRGLFHDVTQSKRLITLSRQRLLPPGGQGTGDLCIIMYSEEESNVKILSVNYCSTAEDLSESPDRILLKFFFTKISWLTSCEAPAIEFSTYNKQWARITHRPIGKCSGEDAKKINVSISRSRGSFVFLLHARAFAFCQANLTCFRKSIYERLEQEDRARPAAAVLLATASVSVLDSESPTT
ncbi:unnamed protein product [Trichogramma brassicae]|uniref:Uncharacterized protein n=1 Tax=Trichogramma brassicae TaxID=86971 RepID=A0A6H5IDM1_9HYME|nr:unnamed protein product [Trichogramma brassicae]